MKVSPASRDQLRTLLPTRKDWVYIGVGFLLALGVVGAVNLIKNAQTPLRPQSDGVSITWLPQSVKYWSDPINKAAKKYNIDPDLVAIIMTLESGGYSKAGSEADAKGLMQITPLTGKDIAEKFLKEPRNHYDIYDPQTNIEFGTAYLSYLRDEFGTAKQGPEWNSTVELVAAGYNGGPGAANNLEQGKGLRDTQTVIYSRDAFNMWRERHASKSPTFERWVERGGSVLLDKAKAEKH